MRLILTSNTVKLAVLKFSSPYTLCFLLVVLVAFISYVPGLSGEFLFDDGPVLVDNSRLGLGIKNFDSLRLATQAYGGNRPLAMLSFALHEFLSGSIDPLSVKLVNLAIHMATGWAIYVLFFSLFRSEKTSVFLGSRAGLAALIGASIWLLHPLHVSTVLYAVQRMAQLSTLFVVLGLLTYVNYRVKWAERGAINGEIGAALLWISLLTLLAYWSKQNGVLLIWLLPLVEFCFFRGQWNGKDLRWISRLALLGIFLPPMVATIYVSAGGWESIMSYYSLRDFSLQERVLTQSRLLWRYLSWLLWPNIFSMGFQHDYVEISKSLMSPLTTLLSLLSWAVVLTAALYFVKLSPSIFFALAFFLIAHSMESSFLPLEMAYEHRNYMPAVGVFVPIAYYGASYLNKAPRKGLILAALVCITLLSSLVFLRSYSWGDDLRFTRDNLARHPDSPRNNYFYGNALLRQWRQKEQLELSERAAEEYAAKGRHYLEIMHRLDPSDVGAIVMLYYIDSTIFRSLGTSEYWHDKLMSTLFSADQVLSATERNALVLLMECAGQGECQMTPGEVDSLTSALADSFPGQVDEFELKTIYLNSRGPNMEGLADVMEEVVLANRMTRDKYPILVAHKIEQREFGEMYRLVIEWLRIDRNKLDLHLQKAIFASD